MKKFTKFLSNSYRVLQSARAESTSSGTPFLVKKLRSFANLKRGWSHGDGVPVTANAIRIAESFVETAALLQLKADVFPGIGGDCAVAFYQGDKTVEVMVNASGDDRFGLHVEEGEGFAFKRILEKDDASHAEVVKQVTQLVPRDAWKSHASFRYASSTQSGAAFQTWSSSTRPDLLSEPQTAS